MVRTQILLADHQHVVLMADELTKIPYAIVLGRRVRRTVQQNVSISVSIMLLLILVTLVYDMPLPFGVIGHEGSTLLVVINGLRLLSFRPSWGILNSP